MNKEITLHQCEAIIEEGLESFHKVERALRIIDEMRLYPEQYRSMEEYCNANWELLMGLNHFFPASKEHVNTFIPMQSVK